MKFFDLNNKEKKVVSYRKLFKLLLIIVFVYDLGLISCKKEEKSVFPSILTKPVTWDESNSANSGGIIGADGNIEVIKRGVVWGRSLNPTFESNEGFTIDGDGPGDYTSTVSPLTAGIKYYLRAYARTSIGSIYGKTLEFTFLHHPVAYTHEPSEISCKSAILNGIVNPNLSVTIVAFEFGTTTSYGLKTTFPNYPLLQDGTYNISWKITGLEPNTIYHYRISGENEMGISYGADKSFKTKEYFINDIDGNKYTILTIGTHSWLKEDLMTTHFNNGDPIPNPVGSSNFASPGYWIYSDQNDNTTDYGLLYNFYAVDDPRNICPDGWHVSSSADFNSLISIVGADSGGNKLKETGLFHWKSPNNSTNGTEFSGLPSGIRYFDGSYGGRGSLGYWWSANWYKKDGLTVADYMVLSGSNSNVSLSYSQLPSGFSVRCVKGNVPWVKTLKETDTTATSAILHATVKANNTQTKVLFEYGKASSDSFQDSITADPGTVSGSDLTQVSAQVTGLTPGENYIFRVKARTDGYVTLGATNNFKTFALPVATTRYAANVTKTTATLCGQVTAYFLPARVTVEYGTSANYEKSIVLAENHYTSEDLSVAISELIPATTYHYRVNAENAEGVYYGQDKTFQTLNLEEVMDVDGNIYNTVNIGSQVWMTQNLKTTKFNDGSAIPLDTKDAAWRALSTPAYCWYNNDSLKYKMVYGAIYNGYTVKTDKLCPIGWHVPNNDEWTTLINYAGGWNIAALKLKEVGTAHWCTWIVPSPVTNETGFTALAGGYRNYDGYFYPFLFHGYWWSSNYTFEGGFDFGTYIWTDCDSYGVNMSSHSEKYGHSVRCIKDQ